MVLWGKQPPRPKGCQARPVQPRRRKLALARRWIASHTSAMQRSRTRAGSTFSDQAQFIKEPAATRACDHPCCVAEGEFRAPKARDRLNEYYWFCLNHIREYNKSWDYYAGMSTGEIEAEIRRDTTWQRPTRPLGFWGAHEQMLRERVMRGYGFEFGRDARTDDPDDTPRRPGPPRTPEEEALGVLSLCPPVDFPRIKARYRELVKSHHPDANGGDKGAEEKLKLINQAYTTLKACYGA
jgi:hypothetical protein